MSYKTLLTLIRSPDDAAQQISAAAQLSRQFDAHLEIICIGIDEVQMGYYFAGADSMLQETSIEMARERAQELLTQAESLAESEGIRWSARGIVSQYGVLGDVVSQLARFVDLVILPPPYGDEGHVETEAILEAVLFSGTAPVLIAPKGGLPDGFPKRAVIGWDESAEALHATRAALPLLQACEDARVTMVTPSRRIRHSGTPGEDLSTMLDRHGVKVQIDQCPKGSDRVSDVILTHVRDTGADLLVMGAYGHSRFREAILGGATREILSDASLPLLLAH
ncbi:universal stress protein [Fluviibacterium sp. DFM31]|uniref:Universal stress protein n=1 Tax=Meridianimarinicoccus marinus TaxID=3231483 RepID=A0ABV3L408_9RHOB